MKNIRLVTLLFISVLSAIASATAQRLQGNLDFQMRFDNREYGSEFSPDQTLFGVKIRPEAGIEWWSDHRIMLGGDFTFDFGAKRDKRKPELILYYGYQTENFRAFTGILQRDKSIVDYSPVFFSDSVTFYDANIEGILLQYLGKNGHIELGFDWNSMISHTDREKFMLFSSGHYRLPAGFSVGYQATMYHFAGTYDYSGVVDNVLAYPYVGYRRDWEKRRPMWLSLRAGWLQALQKDRRFENEFVSPGGFQAEAGFEWNRIGVKETLYAGDNLMPYYERYGSGLYMGDQFYRTDSGIYNRIEIYWKPVENPVFDLKVSSVHHYDGYTWGWQQWISFRIKLDPRAVKHYRKRK